jgi:ribosome-associated heat shock protein Hsp15
VSLIRATVSIFRMLESSNSRVRIDKWLWAVRLFKTRSLAAEACRRGRVTIDGRPAKPSGEVHINNLVVVTGEVTRRFKVLQPLSVRVGAARVGDFAEDQTPASALERRKAGQQALAERPPGSGRPTKRDRRQIERLFT